MAAAWLRRDVTETVGDGTCRQHQSPIKRYCKQCSEAACDECVIANHSNHDECIAMMSEYAQEVKRNTTELLALASNLPFFRIKYAAERTLCISEKRRDDLLKIVDHTVRLAVADIQNTLEYLDVMKQGVTQIGTNILNEETVVPEEVTAEYLETVDTVVRMLNADNPASLSDMGLEFVGMRPDGSVGDFLTGRINIIGNVVNGQTITYIADNRKRDSVIIIGSGHLWCASVSKWIKSFCVMDQQNQVVFSNQIRATGKEELLLLAVGRTIYKIDTSVGECIAEQIDTIHVKKETTLLDEASSISGIDWCPENDGSLAVFSLNIGKSLYLIDIDTKTLVRSFSTVLTNPSVISCRKVGNGVLTIASDNAHPFKFVVINKKGKEEFRIRSSEGIAGYNPWVGCWVDDITIKIAVVWCRPKPHHWRFIMHDVTGRVIQALDVHGSGTTIPISIAYNPIQKSFAICCKEGIFHVPVTK